MNVSDHAASFFFPGCEDDPEAAEDAFQRLRDAVETVDGRAARSHRILSLACRLGGRDCELKVGEPDPISGEPVLGIFDMGHRRFGICTSPDGPPSQWLDKQVYSVTRFT